MQVKPGMLRSEGDDGRVYVGVNVNPNPNAIRSE
jgi:hypothetical protein